MHICICIYVSLSLYIYIYIYCMHINVHMCVGPGRRADGLGRDGPGARGRRPPPLGQCAHGDQVGGPARGTRPPRHGAAGLAPRAARRGRLARRQQRDAPLLLHAGGGGDHAAMGRARRVRARGGPLRWLPPGPLRPRHGLRHDRVLLRPGGHALARYCSITFCFHKQKHESLQNIVVYDTGYDITVYYYDLEATRLQDIAELHFSILT